MIMNKIKPETKTNIKMEKKKMRLVAYAKLLNRKINSANNKAKNPFMGASLFPNPFNRPFYNTLVWVEPDVEIEKSDKNE